MIIIADILLIFGALIMSLCTVGFFRSSNIFLSVKLIFISNVYGLSILLVGFLLQDPTIVLAIKIAILIALNIIITVIINHLIIKNHAR